MKNWQYDHIVALLCVVISKQYNGYAMMFWAALGLIFMIAGCINYIQEEKLKGRKK